MALGGFLSASMSDWEYIGSQQGDDEWEYLPRDDSQWEYLPRTGGMVQGGNVPNSLVDFVKNEEGYSPKAYSDYKQYSIGYGSRASGPNEVIDQQEAERRLIEELSGHYQNVVTAANKVGAKLTPGQLDALTSFDYNTGAGAYLIESSNGDVTQIEQRLPQYNKAGGKTLEGLVNRRQRELGLFKAQTHQDEDQWEYLDSKLAEAQQNVPNAPSQQAPVASQPDDQWEYLPRDMGHGAEVPPPVIRPAESSPGALPTLTPIEADRLGLDRWLDPMTGKEVRRATYANPPAPESPRKLAQAITYMPEEQIKGKQVTMRTTDPGTGAKLEEPMDAWEAQNTAKRNIDVYSMLVDCLELR